MPGKLTFLGAGKDGAGSGPAPGQSLADDVDGPAAIADDDVLIANDGHMKAALAHLAFQFPRARVRHHAVDAAPHDVTFVDLAGAPDLISPCRHSKVSFNMYVTPA